MNSEPASLSRCVDPVVENGMGAIIIMAGRLNVISVCGAASGTISSGTTGNIHNADFTVSSAANGGENSAIPTDGRLSIRTSLTACTAPSNGERHSQPRLSFDSKIVNTAQSGKFLFPSQDPQP
ncbi:hypothetical protein BLNAU_5156 [Blattamonas nauphoetae]|uniref:Tox-PAAR-like domain-containing protein n=1 Tax=Blattamonas nauphoetae TaxID=2049346 RepID=A0ABQ9Y8G6_9EUKA|nr:hypothetical protein BLNAU_5156 [Blattamonas nauphoetae]